MRDDASDGEPDDRDDDEVEEDEKAPPKKKRRKVVPEAQSNFHDQFNQRFSQMEALMKDYREALEGERRKTKLLLGRRTADFINKVQF